LSVQVLRIQNRLSLCNGHLRLVQWSHSSAGSTFYTVGGGLPWGAGAMRILMVEDDTAQQGLMREGQNSPNPEQPRA
jgi:hypothetical protein